MSYRTITITHSCGHDSRTKVTGHDSRSIDAHAARLAGQPCPECRASARAVARERDNAADEFAAKMTGTPKQISWALSIRRGMVAAAHLTLADEDTRRRILAVQRNREDLLPQLDQFMAAWASTVGRLSQETDASWWIDNRGGDLARIAADQITAKTTQAGDPSAKENS